MNDHIDLELERALNCPTLRVKTIFSEITESVSYLHYKVLQTSLRDYLSITDQQARVEIAEAFKEFNGSLWKSLNSLLAKSNSSETHVRRSMVDEDFYESCKDFIRRSEESCQTLSSSHSYSRSLRSFKESFKRLERNPSQIDELNSIILNQKTLLKNKNKNIQTLVKEVSLKAEIANEYAEKLENLQKDYVHVQKDYLNFAQTVKYRDLTPNLHEFKLSVANSVKNIETSFFMRLNLIKSNCDEVHSKLQSAMNPWKIEILKSKLDQVKWYRDQISHKNKMLEEETEMVETLKKQIEMYSLAKENDKKEIQSLQAEVHELQNQKFDFQQELERLKLKHSETKTHKEKTIQELQKDVHKYQSNNSTLRAEIINFQEECNLLKHKVQEFRKEKENYSDRQIDLEKDIEIYSHRQIDLEKEIEIYSNRQIALEKEIEIYSDRQIDLEKEIEKLNRENTEYKFLLNEGEKDFKHLKKIVSDHQLVLSSYSKNRKPKRHPKLFRLMTKVQSFKIIVQGLKEQVKNYNEDNQEIIRNLWLQHELISSRQTHILNNSQEKIDLEFQLNEMKCKLEEYEAQDKTNTSEHQLRNALSTYETSNRNLGLYIANLRDEFDMRSSELMHNALARINLQEDKLRSIMHTKNEDIMALESKLEGANCSLYEKARIIKQLKNCLGVSNQHELIGRVQSLLAHPISTKIPIPFQRTKTLSLIPKPAIKRS